MEKQNILTIKRMYAKEDGRLKERLLGKLPFSGLSYSFRIIALERSYCYAFNQIGDVIRWKWMRIPFRDIEWIPEV